MRMARWSAAGAACLLLASAGCSADDSRDDADPVPSEAPAFGVHLAVAEENDLVMEALVSGNLRVNQRGCFMLSGTPILVPHGSRVQQCFPDHPPFEWADLG